MLFFPWKGAFFQCFFCQSPLRSLHWYSCLNSSRLSIAYLFGSFGINTTVCNHELTVVCRVKIASFFFQFFTFYTSWDCMHCVLWRTGYIWFNCADGICQRCQMILGPHGLIFRIYLQSRLADLVHHMGGSIRKDFSSRVTHLVANCTGGEKYRVRKLIKKFKFEFLKLHMLL